MAQHTIRRVERGHCILWHETNGLATQRFDSRPTSEVQRLGTDCHFAGVDPSRWPVQPDQGNRDSRLARAGFADQPDDAPGGNLEVDIAHCWDVAIRRAIAHRQTRQGQVGCARLTRPHFDERNHFALSPTPTRSGSTSKARIGPLFDGVCHKCQAYHRGCQRKSRRNDPPQPRISQHRTMGVGEVQGRTPTDPINVAQPKKCERRFDHYSNICCAHGLRSGERDEPTGNMSEQDSSKSAPHRARHGDVTEL